MIVDPEHNNTMVSGSLTFSRFSVLNEMGHFQAAETPLENPPSYDFATEGAGEGE